MGLATLYRAVGPKELKLIEESGWKQFSLMQLDYLAFFTTSRLKDVTESARSWCLLAYGSGYVLKTEVPATYLQNNKDLTRGELWIDELSIDDFNSCIVGEIIVTQTFRLPD